MNVFCRKRNIDQAIYMFIAGQRFAIPSLSVDECARSFQKFNGYTEDDMTLKKITRTFWRIQKEIIDEQKGEE